MGKSSDLHTIVNVQPDYYMQSGRINGFSCDSVKLLTKIMIGQTNILVIYIGETSGIVQEKKTKKLTANPEKANAESTTKAKTEAEKASQEGQTKNTSEKITKTKGKKFLKKRKASL